MKLAMLRVFAVIGMLAALGGAKAQQDGPETPAPRVSVPLNVYLGGERLPTAWDLADKTLSVAEAQSLVESKAMLQAAVWQLDDKSCFVDVGIGSEQPKGKTPRAPFLFAWSMSEQRRGEADDAPCQRAFLTALKTLAKDGTLTDKQILQGEVGATSEPLKADFQKTARQDGVVSHWTGGTLNDTGKQAIADELGPRWHKVLDHRQYAAHLTLMSGTSVEGKSYCLARYGVTTVAPKGYSSRLPAYLRIVRVYAGKDENCSRKVVMASLERLHDEYEDLLGDFSKVTEPGVNYLSAVELRKRVAKFDADEAKRAEAAQKAARAREVASTTNSVNRLSCHNECFNGSCTRTFSDGRKERWQAPRKFNPFTQNWEWDTTTNACGM